MIPACYYIVIGTPESVFSIIGTLSRRGDGRDKEHCAELVTKILSTNEHKIENAFLGVSSGGRLIIVYFFQKNI